MKVRANKPFEFVRSARRTATKKVSKPKYAKKVSKPKC